MRRASASFSRSSSTTSPQSKPAPLDDAVLRSIARWPNVPAVYGWLALDRRGNFLIKGERIGNPALREFICRNYAADERGCWYFQNGPQRVFVRLAYTPFVVHFQGDALLDQRGAQRIPEELRQIRHRDHCALGRFAHRTFPRPSSSLFEQIFGHTFATVTGPCGIVPAYKPRSRQSASTRRLTPGSISMRRPHRRAVSPGHLFVASIPIFEPSPASGLAKSR